jgi:glutamine amidotransferase
MIAVIDYGLGNLFSLTSSLKALGAEVVITSDIEVLESAERMILPGVGSFGDAIRKLDALQLTRDIGNLAWEGRPLLGICLGMQLLFEESREYGRWKGLELIPGHIAPLKRDFDEADIKLKVPHMGWNALQLKQKDNPLLKYIQEGDQMYFVHSYYGKDCASAVVASAEYGLQIPAIVNYKCVYGCQFHPEKSGEAGLNILRAFLEVEA